MSALTYFLRLRQLGLYFPATALLGLVHICMEGAPYTLYKREGAFTAGVHVGVRVVHHHSDAFEVDKWIHENLAEALHVVGEIDAHLHDRP